MPNWCCTTFRFYSNNLGQLEEFYNRIREYTDEPRVNNGFGNNWLGNVIDGFGFDWSDVRCRGSITFIDDELIGDSFSMDTETAWVPMTRMWNLILEKYYPDVHYVFQAEEPGCGLFINTDDEERFFIDKYHIDICYSNHYDTFYSNTEIGVVKEISEIFNNPNLKTLDDVNAFAETVNNADNDDYIYVNEFEYVSCYEE